MAKINGMQPADRVKKILDDYANDGGNVYDLKKGDPAYEQVKNAHVVVNGVKLTLHEKFVLAGYNKRVRKAKTIAEITAMLDEFVEKGGNVNDLSSTDELYRLVNNIDKALTICEKFALCKHPRGKKKSANVFVTLKEEIEAYIKAGGSLHVERKSLPFYERMHSAKRTYFRRTGIQLSTEELFDLLGIEGYSDTYYNYLPIFEFDKFKDKDGFVDSYRSDKSANEFVDREAEKLGVPISVFVLLVANQNLKRCVIQTDVLSFISNKLSEYKEIYGSYDGISENDSYLYNKLCGLKKTIVTEDGRPVSTKTLVALLGEEDNAGTFSPYTNVDELDFDKEVVPLIELARKNENMLYAKDIEEKVYRNIINYVARNNSNIKDYFAGFGVNYVDYKGYYNHTFLYIEKYPYIDEMKQERDALFNEFAQAHPKMIKEKLFEKYLEICKEVYLKYKEKIESFGLKEDFDSSGLTRRNPNGFGE